MAVAEIPDNLASRAWVSPARLRRSRTTFIRTYNYNASVADSRGPCRRHPCTSAGFDVKKWRSAPTTGVSQEGFATKTAHIASAC
jgi:hypothetical protein